MRKTSMDLFASTFSKGLTSSCYMYYVRCPPITTDKWNPGAHSVGICLMLVFFQRKKTEVHAIPDEVRGSIVDIAVNLSAHNTYSSRFRSLSPKMYLETNELIRKNSFKRHWTYVVDRRHVHTALLVAWGHEEFVYTLQCSSRRVCIRFTRYNPLQPCTQSIFVD